jgi:hypothetical protein
LELEDLAPETAVLLPILVLELVLLFS